jgi:hypothetical protein
VGRAVSKTEVTELRAKQGSADTAKRYGSDCAVAPDGILVNGGAVRVNLPEKPPIFLRPSMLSPHRCCSDGQDLDMMDKAAIYGASLCRKRLLIPGNYDGSFNI